MKFYQKAWFILLMVVFVPPFGIFLLWKFSSLNKIIKGIISVPLGFYALIFSLALFMPSASNPPDVPAVAPSSNSIQAESSKPASSSSAPVESSKPAASNSAPVESGKPAASSAPSEKTPVDASQQRTVYYTRTGSKYHYANPCGKGTYYPCTLDEALNKNLGPCEKCVN